MKELKKFVRSSIRRFLLITLSHAESRGISREEIQRRLLKTFVCRSVIVAQEKHQDKEEGTEKHPPLGTHFHVAVLNENASKNNATRIIRELFPEFEGRQCHVTFHKGWNTICAYVSKEDEDPLVWGEYSLEQIIRIGQNVKNKVKNMKVPNSELINQLSKCEEWLNVYNQPELANELLRRYSNFRKVHEDLQILQMQRASFAERIVAYLEKKGRPKEYLPEEIHEKYFLLDWIACQLAFTRPIKTKQLFLYGEPSTQKTLLLHFLAKAMRIYFVSSRPNDFAEADNFYDLWVFDEFHENLEHTDQNSNETHQANTLLKVLDGQECRLDSKYGKIFKKNRNVPILMIANRLPWRVKRPGPMRERFLRLRFQSQIAHLKEDRIIATLWGCFFRRIDRQFSFLPNNCWEKDILLQYNSAIALISPPLESFFLLPYLEDETLKARIIQILTREGPEMLTGTRGLGKNLKVNYPYLDLSIFEGTLDTVDLSLMQFAFIPIQKREDIPETMRINQTLTEVFKSRREGTTFRILRNVALEYDYIVWPAYMTPVKTSNPPSAKDSMWIWPNNDKPEKGSGQEKEWPVKLHTWGWGEFIIKHLKDNFTRVEQPGKDPEPRGFWKISLGVPPAEYNGDWGEDD